MPAMSKGKQEKAADREQHKQKERDKKIKDKQRKNTALPARYTKGKK